MSATDYLETRIPADAADPPMDTFQAALAAVTGTQVDLRGAASPAGGWLQLGGGSGQPWMTLTGFGTTFFSVYLNATANEAWSTAIGTVEQLDQELFSGKYGLMNVQQLRDAEAMCRGLSDTLATATADLTKVITPLQAEQTQIAGSAADVLLGRLTSLQGDVQATENLLTDPSPTVAETLLNAAEALSTFGRQMAYIYWESNQVLLNAVALGTNGIHDNISNYLSSVSQVTNVADLELMLGRYTSTAVGDLPNQMAPISGDLRQQPVWDAANAAITHMITTELDKMDVVARTVSADLKTAYKNATERLQYRVGIRSEAPKALRKPSFATATRQ